jgi:hypothetical protein
MEDIGDSEERIAGRQHGLPPAMRCFNPLSFRLMIWAFDMTVINSQQLTASQWTFKVCILIRSQLPRMQTLNVHRETADACRIHLDISHCS